VLTTEFVVFWVVAPEDGVNTVLQNVGIQLPHYTAQQTRKHTNSKVNTAHHFQVLGVTGKRYYVPKNVCYILAEVMDFNGGAMYK
jgi:hypothetical protein